MTRLLGAVVASVVGLSLAPLAASPAAADPVPAATPGVGAQFHGLWSDWTTADQHAVLDKLAGAGMRWVRVDVGWASVEEHGKGQVNDWYVRRFDRVVDAARARGIQVLATLWTTPSWANGGAGTNAAPADPAEYGRIAGWMADRYRGRVAAWEIWNEPNQDAFLAGARATTYVPLLKAAYPAIKAADPAAQVVFGGTAYNDTPWIEAAYAAGAKGSFDVMATHPYEAPSNEGPSAIDNGEIWRFAHLKSVHALMTRHGDGHLPVWATEIGWSTHADAPGTPPWKRGVTPEQQAQYSVAAIGLAKSAFPFVKNIFFYTARDIVTSDAHEANFGLLTRDLREKPVMAALRAVLLNQTLQSVGPASPMPSATAKAPANTVAEKRTTVKQRARTGWNRKAAARR